jgi:hypothetical protein
LFQQGLLKHRKATHIQTCLSTLPRVTFMNFE